MKKQLLLLSFFLMSTLFIKAQERTFADITTIYEKVIALSGEENYEDALTELQKIPKYDTTYEATALQIILANMQLENWDEAIDLCQWGIENDGEYLYLFHQNLGACFSRMGNYDKALEINQKALEIFPKRVALKYNVALNYLKKGTLQKSKETFQEIILESPYFSDAHLQLGKLALGENETARMMMCFNTYLLCESDFDKANSVLVYLNQLATAKKDSIPTGLFKDDNEDFDRLNLILDNYVALDKKYKTGTKVDFPAIRQNHLLFNQLAEKPNNAKGFWGTTYVPIFRALINADQFENHTWYLLQASASKEHKKLLSKKGPSVDRFNDWFATYLANNWILKKAEEEDGLFTHTTFYDNSGVKRFGSYNRETGSAEDKWEYYGVNGRKTAVGKFQDNTRSGDWKWYYASGKVKSEANLENGKVNGQQIEFYNNGHKKSEGTYLNGDRNGAYKEYYLNGNLNSIANYEKNDLQGISLNYHVNGALSDSMNFVNDKVVGEYFFFHPNGQIKRLGNAKEGLVDGTIKEYFNNGQLKSEFAYVDDAKQGEGKEFFKSGALSYEGTYEEGKRVNKHISYNQDGSKYFESTYDENGKENGSRVFFDNEGKPHEIYVYSKGFIAAYQFLDKEGSVVKEAKKKGDRFEYNSIYFDGTPKDKGLYDFKGGKEGKWESRNSDGVLASMMYYKKNELEGDQKHFHPNGKVKSEYKTIDGQREGEYKSYFIDGTLKQNGRYVKGLADGEWFSYFPNGQLSEIAYYVKDELQFVRNYTVDDKTRSETYYVQGTLDKIEYYTFNGDFADEFSFDAGNGKLNYKYDNQQLQVSGSYILGKRHGEFEYYEFDGRKASNGEYFLGDRNGAWDYYHENGQQSDELKYHYGDVHDKKVKWDWFGNKTNEGQYSHGDPVGKWTYYYPSGEVESTSEYSFGEYHGKRENFAPNGELQMVRYYDHGILISYSYLGKDNKLIEPIKVNRLNDHLKAHYPNGNLAREFKLDQGMLQGDLIEYFPNGEVSYRSTYIDDSRVGKRIAYDANGKLYSETDYKYDDKHGNWTVYWPNGKKRLEIPFVLGEKHGIGHEFDKNGQATIEYEFSSNHLLSEKKL
jgi:antitoxin component YwqK of YwqJK toxin-antitoxin module